MFSGFRHLKLERPLVVLDLETTGTDPRADRIVEVAALRCEPSGRVTRRRQLVDPGVPIPVAASAVHGITDAVVAGKPRFAKVAPRLVAFLGEADLAGYNLARFDLRLLLAELDRCGLSLPLAGRSVVDPYEVFAREYPRHLNAAVATYLGEAPARERAQAAHGALADAAAAAAVLDAQLVAHPHLPASPAALQRVGGRLDGTGLFRLDRETAVFGFGKHRGKPLVEVAVTDPDYCHWMLATAFPDDALELVRVALGRA